MSNKLREVSKWNGQHRGVNYEVSLHDVGGYRPDGIWCYYIYINEKNAPEAFENEFWLTRVPPTGPDCWMARYPHYPYSNAAFANVDWHGGVTFYEKVAGFDGAPRCVKIGCDYNHLWDQDHSYSAEYVAQEARRTIDQLIGALLVEEAKP